MDFSFSGLFAGFVFGVFGVYFIKRGRELASFAKILAGVLLVVFTAFVPSPWSWLVGAGLMLAGFKID